MRVPTHRFTTAPRMNMTPMIDVVFQLIIFFLVSSHLAKQEVQLKLPLPTARTGQDPVEQSVPRLTVNVLADGTLTLAGRPVTAPDLALRLRDRLADAGPGLQVRIRSDRSTPYRFVEPIMLACARAGIWDVSFAVYRPEDVH